MVISCVFYRTEGVVYWNCVPVHCLLIILLCQLHLVCIVCCVVVTWGLTADLMQLVEMVAWCSFRDGGSCQGYIRDKSVQLPIPSWCIHFLAWRSNASRVGMAPVLIFLRNIMWKLWRHLCSTGMTSKRLTKHTIWEIAEVVCGNWPEDLLCSRRETPRQLYCCGWQRCFRLAQIHLDCPGLSARVLQGCPRNRCKPPLENGLELHEYEVAMPDKWV